MQRMTLGAFNDDEIFEERYQMSSAEFISKMSILYSLLGKWNNQFFRGWPSKWVIFTGYKVDACSSGDVQLIFRFITSCPEGCAGLREVGDFSFIEDYQNGF